MNEIFLKTSTSTCTVLPSRGGLVSSLTFHGHEHLWLPDDFSSAQSSWPGGGIPLCFPFAGRVWHQGQLYQYSLDDTTYAMPLHGFAFGETWRLVAQDSSTCTLELTESEGSKALFPFAFNVRLTIALAESSLRYAFRIEHQKPLGAFDKMPVALGFHPYFKLTDSDHTHLETSAKKYYPVTPAGAAGKVSTCDDLGTGPWKIKAPLLNSLIFSEGMNGSAKLHLDAKKTLKMTFGPETVFHHLVVWTNRPQEFYCVEPWMSLPDAVALSSGCQWLEPGKELSGFFEISMQ